MVDELDMRHFETLRQRINSQLTRLGLSEQTKYQWLYGALGAVPSMSFSSAKTQSGWR